MGRPRNTNEAGEKLPTKPKNNDEIKSWSKYTDVFINLDSKIILNIDLIFIDGRFRVACCLKCFKYMNNNSIILFDDFKIEIGFILY